MTLVAARIQRRASVEKGHVVNVPELGAVFSAPLSGGESLHDAKGAVL